MTAIGFVLFLMAWGGIVIYPSEGYGLGGFALLCALFSGIALMLIGTTMFLWRVMP